MDTTKTRAARKTRRRSQASGDRVEAVVAAQGSYSRSTHVTATTDVDVMVAFASAPLPIRSLVLELLVSSKEPAAQIFLARAVRVLLDLSSTRAVVEAASARTDYEVLLSVLKSREIVNELVKADPLAQAKLRGIEAKKRLLSAEGGILSTQEVASLLDISPQAIHKRRRAGKLIGIAQGLNQYYFPAWQFEGNHTVAGLEKVLGVLSDHDPLMQVVFMLNPNDRLDGQRPLDLLRANRLDEVLTAAKTLGEHGAT